MTRRLVLHLLVAILAFVVGVTAAMLLGSASSERTRKNKCRTTQAVFYTTAAEDVPPRHYSCPTATEFSIHALPEAAAPPLPPRLVERKEVRVRIKRADGSLQVIKSR